MEKIKIIQKISKEHPSLGVKKGWSEYVGGMADTGRWFFEIMINESKSDLQSFLEDINKKSSHPERVLTEEERTLSEKYIKLPNGGFINALTAKDMGQTIKENEFVMFFGGIDPYKK